MAHMYITYKSVVWPLTTDMQAELLHCPSSSLDSDHGYALLNVQISSLKLG